MMRSIDQRLSKQRLRDYEIIYGEKRASLREVVERVLLQKVIALGAKIAYEMMCLQGSVKISTHVMTMLKRNLQAHNRILPIREFVREVKLHDPFMKLGCLDFGTKCIGTAATDETKQFTFPVGMIPVKQPPKTAESLVDLHRQLQEFSKKENIRYIVVGFPMMPGASKEMTPLGHHIIWSIQGMPQAGVALTFCMWDEEYSTSEAKAAIKSVSGKRNVVLKHKDAVAASIILKNFLHSYRF